MRYHPPVTIRLRLAPSIGTARARARAELLESSLGAELGEPVEIRISDSYEELEDDARSAGAELVWAPPAVVARIEPLARAIFKCVRSGHSSYRSALVMRRGEHTAFTSGEGLRAAWVDPLSMGGYLLAMDHLVREGLEVETFLAQQKFLGSYPDAIREVVYDKADITAVGVHSDDPAHIDEAISRFGGAVHADRLAHVAVTRAVPSDALVVTEALDPHKTERLASRLLPASDHRAPAGLCLALEVEGFVRANPGEYAAVRDLLTGPR